MRWFLLLFCWSLSASASEAFPEIVEREYGLPAEPPCVLCHTTEEGMKGTATRPFAVTLSRLGVQGGSPGSLTAALRQARSTQSDSDADGYADHDELSAGLNPNDAEDGPEGGPIGPPPYSGPLPQHGCSVAPSGRTSRAPLLMLATCLLGLAARRRQRAGNGPLAS